MLFKSVRSVGLTLAPSFVTARLMEGPGLDTLDYGLYTDVGRATNWGNTVGDDAVTGTGSGAAQTLTVYGQIPAGQLIEIGAYTDTITATVTYN